MARSMYHPMSFFFVLSTVLFIMCYAASSPPCLQQKQTPLFIFGDSLSDPGNNNYLNTTSLAKANCRPYGMTFFKYPSGRFSDGRLVTDFIAEYADIPLIPAYLQPGYHRYSDGANFASGGAGVLVETGPGLDVYEKGGRKFWVPNLAPFGCIPVIRVRNNNSCWEEANALAKLHNQELLEMLQKLEFQLKGFEYSTSDFYSFLLEIINFPSRHGLKEGERACCGVGPFGGNNLRINFGACEDLSDYVFFDAFHPTEAVNQEFASIVWNGNRYQTWPYNLKELFEAN